MGTAGTTEVGADPGGVGAAGVGVQRGALERRRVAAVDDRVPRRHPHEFPGQSASLDIRSDFPLVIIAHWLRYQK